MALSNWSKQQISSMWHTDLCNHQEWILALFSSLILGDCTWIWWEFNLLSRNWNLFWNSLIQMVMGGSHFKIFVKELKKLHLVNIWLISIMWYDLHIYQSDIAMAEWQHKWWDRSWLQCAIIMLHFSSSKHNLRELSSKMFCFCHHFTYTFHTKTTASLFILVLAFSPLYLFS